MALRAPSHREGAASRPAAAGAVGERALDPNEAWAFYDERARALLGLSADEFEERLAAGELRERMEDSAVQRVAMVRSERPANPAQ